MAQQFVVPQFLDVEAKIIGPITGRQFVILLATLGAEFLIYSIFLNVAVMIILGLPTLATGIIFAFARVNGKPFHFIVLNMIQTFRKPRLRVWDKTIADQQLRQYLKKEVAVAPPAPTTKAPISASRLSDVSLVVNTGGVYRPEDDIA